MDSERLGTQPPIGAPRGRRLPLLRDRSSASHRSFQDVLAISPGASSALITRDMSPKLPINGANREYFHQGRGEIPIGIDPAEETQEQIKPRKKPFRNRGWGTRRSCLATRRPVIGGIRQLSLLQPRPSMDQDLAGSPPHLSLIRLKAGIPVNIQFDQILWMCPITEVVSWLSDRLGNDEDLPW